MLSACKKYLDVVPDSIATIESAFTLRTSAERYLFSCFSYLPGNASFNDNPAFNSGDEVWYMDPIRDVDATYHNIARGLQNADNPLGNFWAGSTRGSALFQAIRKCNTFLENVDKVPDLNEYERERWKAEVIFLKAYYHFYLFRMYGPIPLTKENLPISASPEEVKVYREPVDSCINYIVSLLDQAASSDLMPDRISGTENAELGRITKCIVKAVKAKVLVTAASPYLTVTSPMLRWLITKGGSSFLKPKTGQNGYVQRKHVRTPSIFVQQRAIASQPLREIPAIPLMTLSGNN